MYRFPAFEKALSSACGCWRRGPHRAPWSAPVSASPWCPAWPLPAVRRCATSRSPPSPPATSVPGSPNGTSQTQSPTTARSTARSRACDTGDPDRTPLTGAGRRTRSLTTPSVKGPGPKYAAAPPDAGGHTCSPPLARWQQCQRQPGSTFLAALRATLRTTASRVAGSEQIVAPARRRRSSAKATSSPLRDLKPT